MKKNNLTTLVVFSLTAFFTATTAHAQTTIDALAYFSDGVTVGNEVDMDFSSITFTALPGGGDTVSIGTDGSLGFAGVFSGAVSGTAGSVDVVAGTNGQVVEIFCDQTATMTDGGIASIDVVSIEAAAENATGGFGAGSACNGVLGAAATSFILNLGVLDTFKLGGQIDGSTAANFAGGSYSTANAGGDDIQIDVFYQ